MIKSADIYFCTAGRRMQHIANDMIYGVFENKNTKDFYSITSSYINNRSLSSVTERKYKTIAQ